VVLQGKLAIFIGFWDIRLGKMGRAMSDKTGFSRKSGRVLWAAAQLGQISLDKRAVFNYLSNSLMTGVLKTVWGNRECYQQKRQANAGAARGAVTTG